MGAARSVLRSDVRTFHMKSGNHAASRQLLLRAPQLLKTGAHGVRASGDDCWKTARHAGLEDSVDSPADLADRNIGVVEVDSRKTVDLQVDEARRETDATGFR